VFERVNYVVGTRLNGRCDSQTIPRRKPQNNHEIVFNNSRHYQIIPGLYASLILPIYKIILKNKLELSCVTY